MKHWITEECFHLFYYHILSFLNYCFKHKISFFCNRPLKIWLADLRLSLFYSTKTSLKSVLLELTYTSALLFFFLETFQTIQGGF